jgi:hypothetical protein
VVKRALTAPAPAATRLRPGKGTQCHRRWAWPARLRIVLARP